MTVEAEVSLSCWILILIRNLMYFMIFSSWMSLVVRLCLELHVVCKIYKFTIWISVEGWKVVLFKHYLPKRISEVVWWVLLVIDWSWLINRSPHSFTFATDHFILVNNIFSAYKVWNCWWRALQLPHLYKLIFLRIITGCHNLLQKWFLLINFPNNCSIEGFVCF